jgi:hypothetical protein
MIPRGITHDRDPPEVNTLEDSPTVDEAGG